jgi:hypothetical protein
VRYFLRGFAFLLPAYYCDAGIAFPSTQVQYRSADNDEFYFQKIFGDGEYIAAGQLLIPPNGHKPTKLTKDNTYVYFQLASDNKLKLTFLVSLGVFYY